MARPREFDEEQVLRRALEVFHAKGFDGTTLDELEQATGLGRGSLHGAFGDKRALFLKALARYLDTALRERVDARRQPIGMNAIPPVPGSLPFERCFLRPDQPRVKRGGASHAGSIGAAPARTAP